MSQSPPKGEGQISHVNSIALREQIGERLRFELDSDRIDTPLHLLELMKRFQ
jgi:hypothetical protein